MKLTRIRIEQFRQFRAPLEIRDLASGLNLFTGPNEAGKSTVVAAIRAAFFERHRSGTVDHLRPWSDPAAAPTVELDFELGGQPCRLAKTFLAKKRCTLQIGREALDGEEAENRLAELLGFQHAGRGASKAEHWGIPGLLWIEQGTGHELREAVAHATDHLRSALDASLGEVAASGGDELLATVEARRNELLTEAGRRARGVYKEALEREAALAAELADLDETIARYRQRVDALAALRREHAADEAEQPWQDFRAREREAAERLDAVRGLETALAAERQRAEQVGRRTALLRDQLAAAEREELARAGRAAAEEEARRLLAATAEPAAQWQARLGEAERALEAARAVLSRARRHDARTRLAREAEESVRLRDAAAARLKEAETAQASLLDLQRQAAASAIPPSELKELREQARDLAEVEIRRSAAATRIRYALQAGASLRLDGEMLAGEGERELPAAAALELPGLGRLEIVPGGRDLAELDARARDLADRQAALLARLGLASPEAAEARVLDHARQQNLLVGAQATLKALALQGVDALRAEQAVLAAQADTATQALAELPAAEEGAERPPTVGQAEAAERAAAESLAAIQADLQQARLNEAGARSRLEAAVREHAAARASCEAPERAGRLAAARSELTDTRAEEATLAARMGDLQQQIAAARPDILQQDVARYRASADELEKRYRSRRDELMRLEVELQTEGAQGQDERRAELARDHAQARRRAAELSRRAQALDLLLTLLRDKRRALTRRLQAPLQKHLNRYLQLLFPQASLEIDEDLAPGPLTRGAESGDFDALSFGAREQMGVIARLAYADLLAEAGRPTLIILDDALVHSDAERLAQMKRVLFDAATRHQILLFTCHPADWRDLGVAARSLEALRAG
ncbi:AAA family ATPase [Pseudothauera rhizosphaerae]|uniref:GTP-binding protein n=1 Tax=Pseudothauera rhizosphaerae TaxID=2565932 RepID=A0A4S4ACY3_9RHOO|nr:AAA family ATPase [Pseudothauera rhizosphaerae]THF56839.1 GTP-binding protein [Pseudothauera rhizosphaerae]